MQQQRHLGQKQQPQPLLGPVARLKDTARGHRKESGELGELGGIGWHSDTEKRGEGGGEVVGGGIGGAKRHVKNEAKRETNWNHEGLE